MATWIEGDAVDPTGVVFQCSLASGAPSECARVPQSLHPKAARSGPRPPTPGCGPGNQKRRSRSPACALRARPRAGPFPSPRCGSHRPHPLRRECDRRHRWVYLRLGETQRGKPSQYGLLECARAFQSWRPTAPPSHPHQQRLEFSHQDPRQRW